MLAPEKEPPQDPRATRRSRTIILTTAAALAVAVGVLSAFTGHVAKLHEQKVLAGDYPHVHMELGAVTVKESGEVHAPARTTGNMRYVASMKLVPPGAYDAVLVAHDGVEKHREKSELVIAARDAQGAWHPPSAARILERLEVPEPGDAR